MCKYEYVALRTEVLLTVMLVKYEAYKYMGVSKNRGTPKWMVYNGTPFKMDDLGVPLFSETSIYGWGYQTGRF